MVRNTPTGNARMRFFPITAIGPRNRSLLNAPGRRGFCAAGFSLIEMMIVITIILILAGIAAGRYERSVQRAKEATLKQDLFVMRNAIQQYTLDKEAGPTSLDDLVQGKYLSGIPTDPITRNKEWHTESEQVLLDPLQTTPGITDVHSTSDQVSPFENTPYNTW
jgi:general secretion pathway protein G